MIKNVLLIAVGGIGFRHFQALLNCESEIQLYVVDINKEALGHAKEYAASVNTEKNIVYACDISDVPEHIDAAILATSSLPRRAVFEEFIRSHTVDYIIFEKMLFPKLEDYDAVGNMIQEKSIKAYVDCIAREYPVYQMIREECKDANFFAAVMKGSDWGLACNAIHLVDQVAFMSGEDPAKITCNGILNNEIVEAKRKGYIEFYGTIIGEIGERCKYVIECDKSNSPLEFEFITDTMYYRVNESERTLIKGMLGCPAKVEKTSIEVRYVSQVTGYNIDKLLKGEDIFLPTYEESSYLHKALLELFIDHMNKLRGTESDICPIT